MDYDAERVLARLSRARRDPEVSGRALLRRSGVAGHPARRAPRPARRRRARRRSAGPVLPARRHRRRPLRRLPRSLLRRRPWQNTFGIDAGTRSFVTSIGCPHRCIFCTSNPGWRQTGRKLYQPIPLTRLKHWAYLLRTAFGARKLIVLDEMVNVRHRLRGDAARLQRARPHLRLPQRHARRPPEPRGRRADAGPRQRCSASRPRAPTQSDLDGPIGKGQKLEAIHRVAAWCQELGVPLMTHYIIGFPWETPAHITATLEMAWELYDRFGAWPSMQFATPIRGTALHEQCVDARSRPARRHRSQGRRALPARPRSIRRTARPATSPRRAPPST